VKHRSRFRTTTGLVAAAVVVLIAAGLAAAGPAGNKAVFKRLPNGLVKYQLSKFYGPCKHQYTVYEFQAHRADAWAQSTAKQVKAYGASHCLKVTNEDAGGYQNVSKQLDQLEAAIAKKPAAIMLWTTDPTAVAGEVKKARAKGIKVIGFTAPPNATTDAVVSGDWHIDGGLMVKAIAKKIGGKGDVLAIWGGAGGSYQTDLAAGANKAAKAFPNVHLTTKTISDFDPAKVTPIVEDELTRNPNLKGVITSIAVMASGAADAIEAANKKGKVFTVSGLIGSKENITDIKTGRIGFMVGVPSVFYADEVVIVTANLLNGKPYPKKTIIPGQVFTASNISKPGALKWELRPEFLK
jgi:putative xylitol transport system substrate-binding protein